MQILKEKHSNVSLSSGNPQNGMSCSSCAPWLQLSAVVSLTLHLSDILPRFTHSRVVSIIFVIMIVDDLRSKHKDDNSPGLDFHDQCPFQWDESFFGTSSSIHADFNTQPSDSPNESLSNLPALRYLAVVSIKFLCRIRHSLDKTRYINGRDGPV